MLLRPLVENLPAARSPNAHFAYIQIRAAAAIETFLHMLLAVIIIACKIYSLVQMSILYKDEQKTLPNVTDGLLLKFMAIAVLWIISCSGVLTLHFLAFCAVRKRLMPPALPKFKSFAVREVDTSHRRFLLLTITLKILFIIATFVSVVSMLDKNNFAHMRNWDMDLFYLDEKYNYLITIGASVFCILEIISLIIEVKCYLFLRELPGLPLPCPRKVHVFDPPSPSALATHNRVISQFIRFPRRTEPANVHATRQPMLA